MPDATPCRGSSLTIAGMDVNDDTREVALDELEGERGKMDPIQLIDA